MSANGWTEAPTETNPEWTRAHERLAQAYAYRAGLMGWNGKGPTLAARRRLAWVERIIEHREAVLGSLRP